MAAPLRSERFPTCGLGERRRTKRRGNEMTDEGTGDLESLRRQPEVVAGREAVRRLLEEMAGESDRGAVLVSVAMLSEALHHLLKIRLTPNPSTEDAFLDGHNSPLGSFSSRIDLAYRIGSVSEKFARDLHLIRRIRNDFAHRAANCALTDPAVRDRIQELNRSHGLFERSPEILPESLRTQYLEAAAWMLYFLRAEAARCAPFVRRHPEFGYEIVLPGPITK